MDVFATPRLGPTNARATALPWPSTARLAAGGAIYAAALVHALIVIVHTLG